ncbi:uncharacterized protein LOC123313440 isoform X2 [Coccinella septempunctata]|uniref:uncharacterized protein LOC123313440 isoform X2 n=1 Tax=Coccinella septempunctata TaxID=41139 RepID=UPI001D088FD6|nr:uncharacterized protein LOC123313440 isoform X2 [Coccinella septempunctata]
MPALRTKNNFNGKNMPPNGLYIHSSPPRVLQMGPAHIKQAVRSGDVDKLEQIVLEGHGKKLLNEHSSDYRTRMYLKSVPMILTQIGLLHDAVNSGNLDELKTTLDYNKDKKKKLVLAKDENGVGLLHKAIYYDLKDIYKYLIEKFPNTVSQKDMEGRTPYHYTAACKDPASVQKMLLNAGADFSVLDLRQHSGKYYMNHVNELELPSAQSSASSTRKTITSHEGLNFKKSNIRIWIHQRNLGNLQQVVWEGNGAKLLPEHSNNPKIKKFLDAVPHIMGLVKEIHTDVINDDLDALKSRRAGGNIPSIVYYGKDANGLTPLHKAAGLGRTEIAEYLLEQNPKSLDAVDNEGRTPLHYSSLLKDNGKMANFLIENGADESALDSKQKTAAYYRTRASELDAKLLQVVPECPRTAKGESYLSNWDWSLLAPSISTEDLSKPIKKAKDVVINNKNGTEEVKDEKPIEGKDSEENGNVADVDTEEDHAENGHEENVNNNHLNDYHPSEENKPQDDNNNSDHLGRDVLDEKPEGDPVESVHEDHNGVDNQNGINDDFEETPEEPLTEDPPLDNVKEDNVKDHHEENMNEDLEEKNNIEEDYEDETPIKRSRPSSTATTKPMTGSAEEETKDESNSKKSSAKSKTSDAEQEGVIEGVVDGEHEVEVLNEEGTGGTEEEEVDVDALIGSGNMEKLAGLVLSGRGKLLEGKKSENPELQAFLDNVPVYMEKIKRIHQAARNGSLRDLQAALDRRKFAIARDAISPDSASPLHVAIIFGNTSIVRYLAGRFPETLLESDIDGRTPLHYAATIADNSHYYNLLIHLGADMRAHDKLGHAPEYYKSNHSEMSHRSLLEKYGEAQLADEMLNDKALGDPLIKGLTEVANKRPDDPIAYLATYLYNFANNKNRSRPKTQETKQIIQGPPDAETENEAVPSSIDVVTVEPEENEVEEDSAFNSTIRDEHGQSMLHFAAARAHGRNALFQLLLESEINVAFRDELYRTARDISIQANVPENTVEIDRYVMHIATKGETDKLVELLLDGYDHITDIVDEDNTPIFEAVSKEDQPDTLSFLQSILTFEEKRERVHHVIRQGSIRDLMELLADENDTGSGKLLAVGKNSYGRCTLHIAVLWQQEEIVDYLANTFPDTLSLGDNLERTALHYAMGVDKMETLSRVLIKAGAKRIAKDLKGRQPTYYFLNKLDIARLQEEEETF